MVVNLQIYVYKMNHILSNVVSFCSALSAHANRAMEAAVNKIVKDSALMGLTFCQGKRVVASTMNL